MKPLGKQVLFAAAMFAFSNVFIAQVAGENEVKSALKNLFNYSKAKAYEKAAHLIAYEGEEKDRVQNDSFNPANKEELNQVKRICKKLSALLDLSSKYELGEFSKNSKDGKEFFSLDVSFVSGDQKLVTTFSFNKTEKGFLLTNMN